MKKKTTFAYYTIAAPSSNAHNCLIWVLFVVFYGRWNFSWPPCCFPIDTSCKSGWSTYFIYTIFPVLNSNFVLFALFQKPVDRIKLRNGNITGLIRIYILCCYEVRGINGWSWMEGTVRVKNSWICRKTMVIAALYLNLLHIFLGKIK